ncbi:hypothetical protein C8F04DRAFT_1184278 [Mycena alexandri]|uniref:Uncharacterized protein n=1 Tax=Mycena alexandri TaxID=1745969 RepID=A0AAD6SWY1_9AGAR|nr:hypothetical protein C8F04DRAFT_1184278 [Mycena alexandri]
MSSAPSFPKVLKSLTHLFDKLLRPHARNLFLDDELEHGTSRLQKPKGRQPHPDIIAAFHRVADELGEDTIPAPSKVLTPHVTTYNGIRYTTNSKHKGNSSIIVAGSDHSLIPMVIETIIQDAADPQKIFMAARQLNAVILKEDPFEAYPVLAAKIWSHRDDLAEELEIILASEIICHFVSCEMQVETVTGELVKGAAVVPLRKSIILEYEEDDEDDLEDDQEDVDMM